MIWKKHIHKLVLCLPDCGSKWNLEMMVFEERGKPEYPEKNLSEHRREPTTNSTHMWRRHRNLNQGHIVGRPALSPLRYPLLPKVVPQDSGYLNLPPVFYVIGQNNYFSSILHKQWMVVTPTGHRTVFVQERVTWDSNFERECVTILHQLMEERTAPAQDQDFKPDFAILRAVWVIIQYIVRQD